MILIWARFLRLPLLPTVWSHLIMATLVSGVTFDPWVFVMFSGIYLYGMGDNDWVDKNRDALLNPNRPLPSGQLSDTTAQRGLIVLLLVAGVAMVFVDSSALRWAGAIALVAATFYNHFLKDRAWLGALSLGVARAAVVGGFPVPWFVPVTIGGATVLITLWSTTEIEHPQRKVWTLRFLLALPLIDFLLLTSKPEIAPQGLMLLVVPLVSWGLVQFLRTFQVR